MVNRDQFGGPLNVQNGRERDGDNEKMADCLWLKLVPILHILFFLRPCLVCR